MSFWRRLKQPSTVLGFGLVAQGVASTYGITPETFQLAGQGLIGGLTALAGAYAMVKDDRAD